MFNLCTNRLTWEENNKGNRSDSLTPVQSECTIVASVRSRQTLTMQTFPGVNSREIMRACNCKILPLNYGPTNRRQLGKAPVGFLLVKDIDMSYCNIK